MKLAQRKLYRSGTQICPICNVPHKLVEHHINGRTIQHANRPFNLVWICPSCHDDIHTGGIIVEGWYSTTKGRELFWHRKGEPIKLNMGMTVPIYGN